MPAAPLASNPVPYCSEAAPIVRPPHVNAEFATDLCRFILSCSMAWWVVEIPFFRHFMRKWIPGVVIPSRQQLSGDVLDAESQRVTDTIKVAVENKHATGACDGWKNIRKDSLIGSTANVEGNPVLLNVNDISARPKTAETLLEIVEKEIMYILNILKAILVAWCTDASGESAKMRRLLAGKHPWIVVLDCWGHQVRLILLCRVLISTHSNK
ncbi:hypothetical protein GGF50DRAFT_54254 [Schizophyllum commune]